MVHFSAFLCLHYVSHSTSDFPSLMLHHLYLSLPALALCCAIHPLIFCYSYPAAPFTNQTPSGLCTLPHYPSPRFPVLAPCCTIILCPPVLMCGPYQVFQALSWPPPSPAPAFPIPLQHFHTVLLTCDSWHFPLNDPQFLQLQWQLRLLGLLLFRNVINDVMLCECIV